MIESDFIIVGAGIGGASSGYWLSKRHRVTLLEMESQPGYHTTGRSVAMYTEAYGPRVVRALARASFEFLTDPPDDFSDRALSERSGFMFIARDDQHDSLEAALREAQTLSPQIHRITPSRAIDLVPILRRDYVAAAFLDPNTLTLDVNAIHQGYLRGVRKHGGTIQCNASVHSPEWDGRKWRIETVHGTFSAPVVINAAGAWADQVGAEFGARPIGLQPRQRTVIAVAPPSGVTAADKWPFVFDTDEQFYFKLDSGTLLASPADETPVPPRDARPEDIDVAMTVDRIERATRVKIQRITRKWAGLRSFAADGVPVVGFDTQAPGFVWCAGQGGYGIETSWAMGEVTASLAAGDGTPGHLQDAGILQRDLKPRSPS